MRVEPLRVRTSVRLIDVAQGRIRWSAQFDRNRPYGIATQKDLAELVFGPHQLHCRQEVEGGKVSCVTVGGGADTVVVRKITTCVTALYH